jgi:hypothetical protein
MMAKRGWGVYRKKREKIQKNSIHISFLSPLPLSNIIKNIYMIKKGRVFFEKYKKIYFLSY